MNKYLFEINNFSTNDISKKEIITIRLNDRTPVLRFTRINSNKWKCDVLKKNNYLDDESLELNNSKVSELLKKISNDSRYSISTYSRYEENIKNLDLLDKMHYINVYKKNGERILEFEHMGRVWIVHGNSELPEEWKETDFYYFLEDIIKNADKRRVYIEWVPK